MVHWIYIIECSNGAYYTGYTTELEHRYQAHLAGKCKYTRSFKPVKLAQAWHLDVSRSQILKIEALIKAQSRELKLKLVQHPSLLSELVLKKLNIDLGGCSG